MWENGSVKYWIKLRNISPNRRRPVWHPSTFSRILTLLIGSVKQITLRRALLAVFILPTLYYLYSEVTRDALIIDPFSVPRQFEEMGLKPDIMADRISDSLREIETETKTSLQKDRLAAIRARHFVGSFKKGTLPRGRCHPSSHPPQEHLDG
jgi:hypothetical protein